MNFGRVLRESCPSGDNGSSFPTDCERADMFYRVQDFSLGLEWRKDPFDPNDDISGRTFLFIYVTGRGEYSYLFPDMADNDIIVEANHTIPMGYTQIWILEWVMSVRPQAGKIKRKKAQPFQRRAVESLRQGGAQERRSYVLLGEEGLCFGWSDKLHSAEGAAKLIAEEKKLRVVIGLLRANITWH